MGQSPPGATQSGRSVVAIDAPSRPPHQRASRVTQMSAGPRPARRSRVGVWPGSMRRRGRRIGARVASRKCAGPRPARRGRVGVWPGIVGPWCRHPAAQRRDGTPKLWRRQKWGRLLSLRQRETTTRGQKVERMARHRPPSSHPRRRVPRRDLPARLGRPGAPEGAPRLRGEEVAGYGIRMILPRTSPA